MEQNIAKIRQEIEKALDEIGQTLRTHGGDVEFVDFDQSKGDVKVRMHGSCVGCPLSEMTLHQVIEASLKEKFPWVKKVMAVE
ncbi:MAG: NifU family protein [Patescibacteria group bacterium]|nr:NifU family protein [Patescibacteria group bacterium]